MDTKKDKEFVLPFGIDFVIQEDLSKTPDFQVWRATGISYDICCPFCGGRRKMNINTAKNVARCNKCGGGQGYNTITLHAALTGLDNQSSFKDLMKRWKGLDSDAKLNYKPVVSVKTNGLEPAPIEIRDKVYRRFLSQLSLSQKHKEDLIRRGLSEEDITSGMYKTVPVVGLHSLAYDAVYGTSVINSIVNHHSWGIPGFTDITDPEKISVRGRKNGYFVPVIQKDGFISGMQIRYDNLPENASDKDKENYKKYSWYSSSEKESGCGVTGCENIHFAGSWNAIPKELNLTEGVLKADVASVLSGKPFLGLVGVNNVGQLKKTLLRLQYLGAESVNLYIDMDYRQKKEVAAALLGIRREINKAGRHEYIVEENDNVRLGVFTKNISKDSFDKGLRISFEEELPKRIQLFLGRVQVPKEKYVLHEKDIEVEYEYINCIRNSGHIFRIVDITRGFDNYGNLSIDEKKTLLSKSVFSEISFRKTGITYKEINWNENYKGIDDYYLYLRSLKPADSQK